MSHVAAPRDHARHTSHRSWWIRDARDRTDVAVPNPGPDQVLVQVGAAGVNNTDVNTRIGWYSKSITSGTDTGGAGGCDDSVAGDGGWAGEGLAFPLIQGAD